MDLSVIKKEVLKDLNECNAKAVKQSIKYIIDDIVKQQEIIKRANKGIAELQKTLKEIECPEEIKESILG